jgi:dihydrofolate reductase
MQAVESSIVNRQSSITLIVAMSRNRVIGRAGALPWRLPADLKRFKQRTMGHAVIMGRKTWDTLKGVPLPGRTNIVITRDRSLHAPGAVVTDSLDAALGAARAAHPDAGEIFIAGGAEIYRLALPKADCIDMTLVDVTISDGDAFFPEFEGEAAWQLAREERHAADARHEFAFAFREYVRERQPDAR